MKITKKKSITGSSKTSQTKSTGISPKELNQWVQKEFNNHFHQSYQDYYYPGWYDLSMNHSKKIIEEWNIEEDEPLDIYYIENQKIVLASNHKSIEDYIQNKYTGYNVLKEVFKEVLKNSNNENILHAILTIPVS
jgi:hypothetical protein